MNNQPPPPGQQPPPNGSGPQPGPTPNQPPTGNPQGQQAGQQQTPQQSQQQAPQGQQPVQGPPLQQGFWSNLMDHFRPPPSVAWDGRPLHPEMHALLTRQKYFRSWGWVMFFACCGLGGPGSIGWMIWGFYLIYELKSKRKPMGMPMKLRVGAGVYAVLIVHALIAIWALRAYLPLIFNNMFGSEYIS